MTWSSMQPKPNPPSNMADRMTSPTASWVVSMEFAARLAHLRKQKGFSQQALADAVGIHSSQIKRYESGATCPSLDALKMLAITLGVSADALLFDEDERGPAEDFHLTLDVISHLNDEEQRIIREVLDAMLLKYQARRWAAPPPPPAKRPGPVPAKRAAPGT